MINKILFLYRYIAILIAKSFLNFINIIIILMLRAKEEECRRPKLNTTIKCGQGSKISLVCTNNDCLFNAFTCSEDQCKSCISNNHKYCSFKKFSHLTEKAEEKLFSKANTQNSIFEIQQKLIQQLKKSRHNFMADTQQKDIKILKIIDSIFQKKETNGLTGATINQLLQQLAFEKEYEKDLKKKLQKFKREGERIIQGLINLRIELASSLTNRRIDSKILRRTHEIYLLKQLNNPVSIKLLFRASQHEFSAAKFHKHCDGVSKTLTIVRTEFGKTIAGYNPFKWNSAKSMYTADDSKSTFLFQLDLKQKMTLIQPAYAFYDHPNYGPIFGQGYDMFIDNRCNQQAQNSFSNFPTSYNYNEKYELNQESWTAFCGNPNGCKFKVIQYEVFVIS